MYVGSLSSSVGLGICVIEHLSIESSVVDSTIRVGIIIIIMSLYNNPFVCHCQKLLSLLLLELVYELL